MDVESSVVKILEDTPDPRKLVEQMQKVRDIAKGAGSSGKKRLGYSDELIEKLYAVGTAIYDKAQYPEAFKLFRELFLLDCLNYKVSFALGATAQRLGEWARAICYYAYAMANDPKAPEPFYFAAECSVQICKDEAAAAFYKQAADLCGNDAKYKDLKERCQILAETLTKRVKEKKRPLRFEAETKTSA
jgi:type III secretion system low calcium response chaperone LcrH/SycD